MLREDGTGVAGPAGHEGRIKTIARDLGVDRKTVKRRALGALATTVRPSAVLRSIHR